MSNLRANSNASRQRPKSPISCGFSKTGCSPTMHPSEAGRAGRERTHSPHRAEPPDIARVSLGGTLVTRCLPRLHPLLGIGLALAGSLAVACATPPAPGSAPEITEPTGVKIYLAPRPSEAEAYCAWYGDAEGSTLYAGLSPFWSTMRAAGGDPLADLAHPGPQWVGRFDLAKEAWLPPLDVGDPTSRAGVWDVHAAQGGVYFTTFYEGAGRVDPATGTVERFDAAQSQGLNELEVGPGGSVLVSRYGSGEDRPGPGELVLLDAAGGLRESVPLEAPAGLWAAPKTPAWDPARGLFWATSDFFDGDGASPRRDAYRIERATGSVALQPEPELQFVYFDAEEIGWLAEVDDQDRLWLRRLAPGDPAEGGTRRLLDPRFASHLDFVQDIKPAPGGVVITRWSGVVHRVDGEAIHSVRLPRIQDGGLYYTGVVHEDRLCATHCGGVSVVCVDAP